MKPGSQLARFLDLLRDGEAHEIREIHREIGVGRPNSRAADLRKLGFVIEHWNERDPRGGQLHFYRLVSEPPPDQTSGLAEPQPLTQPETVTRGDAGETMASASPRPGSGGSSSDVVGEAERGRSRSAASAAAVDESAEPPVSEVAGSIPASRSSEPEQLLFELPQVFRDPVDRYAA